MLIDVRAGLFGLCLVLFGPLWSSLQACVRVPESTCGVLGTQGNIQLLPPAPLYYPFRRGKIIHGELYGVLLWDDMNAATPLGALCNIPCAVWLVATAPRPQWLPRHVSIASPRPQALCNYLGTFGCQGTFLTARLPDGLLCTAVYAALGVLHGLHSTHVVTAYTAVYVPLTGGTGPCLQTAPHCCPYTWCASRRRNNVPTDQRCTPS